MELWGFEGEEELLMPQAARLARRYLELLEELGSSAPVPPPFYARLAFELGRSVGLLHGEEMRRNDQGDEIARLRAGEDLRRLPGD